MHCGDQLQYKEECCMRDGSCEVCAKVIRSADYFPCKYLAGCQRDDPRSSIGHPICDQCQGGFTKDEHGICRKDKNECKDLPENGGCGGNLCINTYGGHLCQCVNGYYYSPEDGSCTRSQCEEPVALQHGSVLPAPSVETAWKANTYAVYQCDAPEFLLLGSNIQTCVAQEDEPRGTWEEAPRAECIQDPLRDNPGKSYHVRLSGLDPMIDVNETYNPGNWRKGYSPRACAYMCNSEHDCRSFLVRYYDYTESRGYTTYNCHTLPSTHAAYRTEGKVSQKSSSDMYTKMGFHSKSGTYTDFVKKMFGDPYGCYATGNISGYVETTIPDVHVLSCNKFCLKLGYDYFGIQVNKDSCMCDSLLPQTPLLDKTQCDLECQGAPTMTCGGIETVSVYQVVTDSTLGYCFSKDAIPSEDVHPLGVGQDSRGCIQGCRDIGYNYAYITNGDDCSCGNHIPDRIGEAVSPCNIPCPDNRRRECGGKEHNSVYATYPAYHVSEDGNADVGRTTAKMYDDTDRVTALTTSLFSELKGLRYFTTERLILYSNDDIQTMADGTINPYEVCGQLEKNENTVILSPDVVLRFFYTTLSDIISLTSSSTERVYVYAQTVVLDTDAKLPFSLLIRADKILISERPTYIEIPLHAKKLDVDLEHVKHNGPKPDFDHMEVSLTCAQILYATDEEEKIRTAFTILHDLTRDGNLDISHRAFQMRVFSYKTELETLQRANARNVPHYSLERLDIMLAIYYKDVDRFRTQLYHLKGNAAAGQISQEGVVNLTIGYTEAAIDEARNELTGAIKDYHELEAAFDELLNDYDDKRYKFMNAGLNFTIGIEAAKKELKIKTALQVVKGLVGIVGGIIGKDPSGVVSSGVDLGMDIYNAYHSIIWNLEHTVQQIDAMADTMKFAFEDIKDESLAFDASEYSMDISQMAALYKHIGDWNNLKTAVIPLIYNDEIKGVSGSLEYSAALIEMANSGEYVTETMVDRAKSAQNVISRRATLDIRLGRISDVQKTIDSSMNQLTSQQIFINLIDEEARDLVEEINDLLFQFCEQWFFTTLDSCSNDSLPAYGNTLEEVMGRISRARKNIAARITTAKPITVTILITDTNTDGICSDVTICPVSYLKKHGNFSHKVPVGQPQLADTDQFRVNEVQVYLKGALLSEKHKYIKLVISSTGQFGDYSKKKNETYTFFTTAVRGRFGYRPAEDSDDYTVGSQFLLNSKEETDEVRRVTPYATWHVQLRDPEKSVDVSQVSEIWMTFKGLGIHNDRRKKSMTA